MRVLALWSWSSIYVKHVWSQCSHWLLTCGVTVLACESGRTAREGSSNGCWQLLDFKLEGPPPILTQPDVRLILISSWSTTLGVFLPHKLCIINCPRHNCAPKLATGHNWIRWHCQGGGGCVRWMGFPSSSSTGAASFPTWDVCSFHQRAGSCTVIWCMIYITYHHIW